MMQCFEEKEIVKLYHETEFSKIKINMFWRQTDNDKDASVRLPYISNNLLLDVPGPFFSVSNVSAFGNFSNKTSI